MPVLCTIQLFFMVTMMWSGAKPSEWQLGKRCWPWTMMTRYGEPSSVVPDRSEDPLKWETWYTIIGVTLVARAFGKDQGESSGPSPRCERSNVPSNCASFLETRHPPLGWCQWKFSRRQPLIAIRGHRCSCGFLPRRKTWRWNRAVRTMTACKLVKTSRGKTLRKRRDRGRVHWTQSPMGLFHKRASPCKKAPSTSAISRAHP